jgi:hypothetical protein
LLLPTQTMTLPDNRGRAAEVASSVPPLSDGAVFFEGML